MGINVQNVMLHFVHIVLPDIMQTEADVRHVLLEHILSEELILVQIVLRELINQTRVNRVAVIVLQENILHKVRQVVQVVLQVQLVQEE